MGRAGHTLRGLKAEQKSLAYYSPRDVSRCLEPIIPFEKIHTWHSTTEVAMSQKRTLLPQLHLIGMGKTSDLRWANQILMFGFVPPAPGI